MENKPQQPAKPVKLVTAQPLNAPQKRPPQGKATGSPAANSNPRLGNKAGANYEEVASVEPLPASALSESQKMRAFDKRATGGRRRRGSRWTIPIALLCVGAAAGFIGFVIYIVNHQAQSDVANSRIDQRRSNESVSEGALGPGSVKSIAPPTKPSTATVENSKTGPAKVANEKPTTNTSLAKPNKTTVGADSSGKGVASNEPSLSDAIKQLPPPSSTAIASLPSGNLPKPSAPRSAPKPAAKSNKKKTPAVKAAPTEPPPLPDPAGDEELLSLFKSHRLFNKTSYASIRHIFVHRFESRYEKQIKQVFGDDFDKMTHWLDKNLEIKEELYLAIDLSDNDVTGALSVFKQIKDKYPEKVVPLANLAIATAVAWGRSGDGIYDYLANVKATHSKSVGLRLDALGNFNYFVLAESRLGDRARALPWEFLVHMVNHYTPLDQRMWAFERYFAERPMFGQCYKDVPFDSESLNSKLKTSKLAGQDYTLENLHKHGGIAAEQADFAARVGKSLGVPAEVDHGDKNFGQLHDWVIWIEIKNFNRVAVGFSLESYGQSPYTKSYVGWLIDPFSAQKITDRDLELRLQAVGADQIGHRQAQLVMRVFPMIRDKTQMSVADQLKFLDAAVKLSPWLDASWLEVAKLAHDGQGIKENSRQFQAFVDRMFITFAAFPDFAAKVFDDLASFQTNPRQREKLNERLVAMFEQAGRPDLATDARLKIVQNLVNDKHYKEALGALLGTVKRFPDEPPYTTRLVDQIEMVCKESNMPHVNESLAMFYRSYLPMIPQKHGDRANPFCIEMYTRGIDLFKSIGDTQSAAQYTSQLAKLKPPDKG